MTSDPLITHPGGTVELPLALFPPVSYFALLASYPVAVINDRARFDKRQKSVHRFDIADTRGRLSLTVPISRPSTAQVHSPLLWNQVAISTHGDWWHVHRISLESAYGRTPFFEFYIDRLSRFFSHDTPDIFPDIATLALESIQSAATILGLNTAIVRASELPAPASPGLNANDLSHNTHAKPTAAEFQERPRYQIRADRLGFIPGLSILDLIFNHGPESPLHLR
ncbi:MAG: WbqC family protein [Muribaculaceae bacterium]|nr:WbqC family protein [Muribaculaceae bacterium]